MNEFWKLTLEQLTILAAREWIRWQERQNLPVGWVPTPEDWQKFIAQVDEDTPENVKARVLAKEGLRT